MAKQENKRSEIRQQAKNDPVSELQGEANNRQEINPPNIPDDIRVVFSEEMNRDSNLDDG